MQTETEESGRRYSWATVARGTALASLALLTTWHWWGVSVSPSSPSLTPNHPTAQQWPETNLPETGARKLQGQPAQPMLRQVQNRVKKGGFDVSNSLVPVADIRSGGPPKDGIPALTGPAVVPASAASFLLPGDRVIGYSDGSIARAYPLKILIQHEIVNDRVGQSAVAVTYCPLCDSAAIFDRTTPAGELEFGVSGLLFNSNVLMYDRRGRPESLWSQMLATGVSGPAAGRTLTSLPLELTTWQDWYSRHPNTSALSLATGHRRNYARNPYARYFNRPQLMFPVRPTNNLLPLKTPVLGVWTNNAARAYVVSSFARAPLVTTDTLDGKTISLAFNPAAGSLRVEKADKGVQWMYAFWFAWSASRPQTDIYQITNSSKTGSGPADR